jgi:hypothetical protein
MAIGAAASVGLSAVAVTKVSELSDRFDDLNNQQMVMMEALKQADSNDKVEKLALKRLIDSIHDFFVDFENSFCFCLHFCECIECYEKCN